MNIFSLQILSPNYLVLLLLLPIFWWLGRNSLAGLSSWHRALALGVRLAIVTLLVLALARLQWQRKPTGVAVYFLVDDSDSIPVNKRQQILSYVSAATKKKKPDGQAGLIHFAANATCEQPPSFAPLPRERQAVIDSGGTDIAAALRLAVSTFPNGTYKRVVLMTDGNQNRGDVIRELKTARASGIQVDVYPVTYRRRKEILLNEVILPPEVREGEPFYLKAVVTSTSATEARLTIQRGGSVVSHRDVHLSQGRNVFRIPLVLAPNNDLGNVVHYEAWVEPLRRGDDGSTQNNSAQAFSRVRGSPTVLYIDGNLGFSTAYVPQLQKTLLRRLHLVANRANGTGAKIRLKLCDVTTIPPPAELLGYDCIILDNVSSELLGGYRAEKIRSLVNGQGVGLVMIGGEHSFGMGNYRGTPIEDALPVEMDLKNKKIIPNGALILAVDRSGSMLGSRLRQVKAAARAALATLSPSDYLGIIAFDSQAHWLVAPTLAQDRLRIRRQIATLSSGGGTDIQPALQAAHKALLNIRASFKHVVILSDGQAPAGNCQKLAQNMARDKITVTTVGVGDKTGQRLMREIAKCGGGGYYFVKNSRQLPRIFIKESLRVKRGLIFEKTFIPKVTAANDEFLAGIKQSAIPPLHGYIATTPKPGADVPLVSRNENHDPILAHWQYGLGQAVAFTSDAKNRWGKDWLTWNKYADFWSGLVEQILRQPPTNLRLVTQITGNRGRLLVRRLSDQKTAPILLNLIAHVTAPNGDTTLVRLQQTGIDTYEGNFSADSAGRYDVAVVGGAAKGKASHYAAYGGAEKPHSAELTRLESDEPFLSQMVSAGAGRMLSRDPAKDELFKKPEHLAVADYRDVWRLLLYLSVCLFVADVFARRVTGVFDLLGERFGGLFINRFGRGRAKGAGSGYAGRASSLSQKSRADFLAAVSEERSEFELEPAVTDSDAGTGERAGEQADETESSPPRTTPQNTYTSRLLEAKKRARKS